MGDAFEYELGRVAKENIEREARTKDLTRHALSVEGELRPRFVELGRKAAGVLAEEGVPFFPKPVFWVPRWVVELEPGQPPLSRLPSISRRHMVNLPNTWYLFGKRLTHDGYWFYRPETGAPGPVSDNLRRPYTYSVDPARGFTARGRHDPNSYVEPFVPRVGLKLGGHQPHLMSNIGMMTFSSTHEERVKFSLSGKPSEIGDVIETVVAREVAKTIATWRSER